jgi:chromate transporter
MAYTVSRFWSRYNDTLWYRTFERGVAPFAVGLILATGAILTASAATEWRGYILTAGTALFMLTLKRSPLIPLAISAALGFLGLV